MVTLKKIFLAFLPLFVINSTLPMWRRTATSQSRNLTTRTATTRSRSLAPSFANRGATTRTAALFTQARRPVTRVVAQRATTPPVRRRVFSSQRTNTKQSWFDWSKWKRSAWAIGTFALGTGISKLYIDQKNNADSVKKEILRADDDSDKITLESIEHLLDESFIYGGKPLEKFFNELTKEQYDELITLISSNFESLSKKEYLVVLLSNILLNNPKDSTTSQKFVHTIINNITSLDFDSDLIGIILFYFPESNKQLTKVINENITTISPKIIKKVLSKKPDLAKQLIQAIIDNIRTIDIKRAWYILSCDHQLVNQLIDPIIENIADVNPEIITKVCFIANAKGSSKIIQAICDNIVKINPSLIKDIIHYEILFVNQVNRRAAQQFCDAANDHLEEIDPMLLSILPLQDDKNTRTLLDKLEKLHKNDPDNVEIRLKMSILQKVCKPNLQIQHDTQTEHHLKNNTLSFSSFSPSSELYKLASRVNKKERELQETHYTFVHGQRWEYQFAETVFTHLQELKNKKQYPDFLFAHVKEIPTNQQEEENIHHNLLQNGRTDTNSRQRLLFMNYAFFGNNANRGSSTAYYVASNANVGHVKINLRKIFEWNGLKYIYDKYQSELEALQKNHSKLSNMGNLVFLAIPKDIVDECVFPAVSGGLKKTIVTKKGWLWNSKTNKTSELLEAIKDGKVKDTDKQEFCLIMTNSKHGGLNPESGIKIFDFNTVDKDKWAAYKAKEDSLFRRIENDIKKSRSFFDYEMAYPEMKEHELFF